MAPTVIQKLSVSGTDIKWRKEEGWSIDMRSCMTQIFSLGIPIRLVQCHEYSFHKNNITLRLGFIYSIKFKLVKIKYIYLYIENISAKMFGKYFLMELPLIVYC